jgi:hypothetical protein
MSTTVGEGKGVEEREERREAVCFLVTMLDIGVVKNLEQAPASAPTANSSRAGRVADLKPFFCRRLVRR